MPGLKRKPSKELSVASPVKLARKSTSRSSSSVSTTTLRRAPTVELKPDDSSRDVSLRKSTSKRNASSNVSTPSVIKTASLIEGEIITAVSFLSSGSSIGKATSITSSEGRMALAKSVSLEKSESLLGKRSSDPGHQLILTTSKISKTDISKETTLERHLKKSLSKSGSFPVLKAKSSTKTNLEHLSSKMSGAGSKNEGDLAEVIGELRKSMSKTDSNFAVPVAPFLPPGGLMEIVFSFDTTGSMYSYLEQVRGSIQDMVQRLQADIPGIRIAIVAHGDYCDASNYIIQWIDFGSTVTETCDFVKNIGRTGGGDSDECYELVLRRVQEVLSWTPGSQRSLVIIGDAHPHEKGYRYGTNNVDMDWREEVYKLRDMGIRIYSVEAGNHHPRETAFYENVAKATDGKHLKLDDFASIFDMIMSICYREGGADLFMAYEAEMRARPGAAGLGTGFEKNLNELRDSPASVSKYGNPTFIIPPVGSVPTGSLFAPTTSIFGSVPSGSLFSPLFGGITPKPVLTKKRGTRKPMTKPKKPKATKIKNVSKSPKKSRSALPKKNTKTALKTKSKSRAMKTSKEQKRRPTAKKTGSSHKIKKRSTQTKRKSKKEAKQMKKKIVRKIKQGQTTQKDKKKQNTRQKREALLDSKLVGGALNKVKWSPWKLAIAHEKPTKYARGWIPCKAGITGVRFKKLWEQKDHPSVYEFAVQAPDRKKLHVVYIRPTRGFSYRKAWDLYLLRHKSVISEVADVVKRGGELLSRRCTGSSDRMHTVGEYLLKNFCYAWRVNRNGKKSRRVLTKHGFIISHSDT